MKKSELKSIIKELTNVMLIQEGRESGLIHLSNKTFKPLWDKAKNKGIRATKIKRKGK
jgi:hypothetical protein